MSSTEPRPIDLEREVRWYITHRHAAGNQYFKARDAAKAINRPTEQVVPVVEDLVRDGVVEIWSDNTNSNIYQIALDDDDDDVATGGAGA